MEKSFILVIITITTGLTAGDDISPDEQEVSSKEGESVTLSCSYRATSENIYLYWYRQHSNQAPQYLLHKGARSYTYENIPDKRFKSTTSRDSTQLTIESPTIADTAIYYCALRDAQVQRHDGPSCHMERKTDSSSTNYPPLEEFPVRPDLGSRVFSSVCLSPSAMMLLCSFLLFAALMDTTTSFTKKMYAVEGENITLSCNYSSSGDYIQWYRQYPRSAPEFLISVTEYSPKTNHPVFRLSAEPNKDNKRVDLELSSAEVTDSAVYYCALRPTVTGNSLTLYKNLTACVKSKEQEIKGLCFRGQ
ncbi:uncharacterized protein [Paramormyrops kingsleyae]|uniref:uncharacterized protein n=1 Tax=Paramormyrops kingsleyae TaxID=1676925 RepID=UPI003B96C9E1